MIHEKRLDAGKRFDIVSTGQYIAYVAGSGDVEITVNGESHYLSVTEVYQSYDGFENFTIRNISEITGDFVIKSGMGRIFTKGDGQVVDVIGIKETVKTEVLNADDVSAPIVEEIDALSGKTLKTNVQNPLDISNPIVTALTQTLSASVSNPTAISNPVVAALAQTLSASVSNPTAISNPIVAALAQTLSSEISNPTAISNPIVAALAQALTVNIQNTVNTLEKPAQSIVTSNKTFTAGESFTIPANTNRRDITIFAAETNTDLVTVAGVPLAAGQYVELKNYVGSIGSTAAAADSITIVEVIK